MTSYLTPVELQTADLELISKLERKAKTRKAMLRSLELAIVTVVSIGWLACAWMLGKPAIEGFLALGPTSSLSGFVKDVAILSLEALVAGSVMILTTLALWKQKDKLKSRGKDLARKLDQMSKAKAARKDEIAAREEAKAIAEVARGPRTVAKPRRI